MFRKTIEAIVLAASLAGCMGSDESPQPTEDRSAPVYERLDDFFVDGLAGSDKNSGATVDKAWKTLSMANYKLTPGQVVYIRAGTYAENISPQAAGLPGSPIAFQGYRNETVVLKGAPKTHHVIALAGKKHIEVASISIIGPVERYASLSGATHCAIRDCVMKGIGPHNGIELGIYGLDPNTKTSFNILENNHIEGHPHPVEAGLETISLFFNAHHNLVRDNTVIDADHTLIYVKGSGDGPTRLAEGPHHNIIVGNRLRNNLHHAIAEGYGAHDNVYDSNIISFTHDSGEGFHLGFTKAIIRRNVIRSSGNVRIFSDGEGGLGLTSRTLNGKLYRSHSNMVYHNTIVSNRGPGIVSSMAVDMPNCFEYPIIFTGNNTFVNNIIAGNAASLDAFVRGIEVWYLSWKQKGCAEQAVSPILGDIWDNNLIGKDPDRPVIWYQSGSYRAIMTVEQAARFSDPRFIDNFSADPLVRSDNALSSSSPAIDQGKALTSARYAGTGTALKVCDSRFFCDGFGITDGDEIQVGPSRARIQKVDYAKNILYLETSLQWQKDAPVSLPWKGSAPDLGAVETR